jgi:serine-type D-Ala-D-Ala endopeptidase (penicillin-binding protein 7)
MLKKYIFILILFSVFAVFNIALAEEPSLDINILKIDTPTLQAGYTINGFDGKFRIGIFPEVLSQETVVALKDFYNPGDILPIPADKEAVSHIYEFDIHNKEAFNNKKPLVIEIKYNSDYVGFRSIYFFDQGKNSWTLLPSYDITGQKKLRANLHLPYAKLIVLEDNDAMETGTASWYKWKNCDCAASPDYPKGTQLKVINLDNGKSVIVTVNDYGPERDKFPNRVIDLDKVAFEKIANPGLGLCSVIVEPYEEETVVITLSSESETVLSEDKIIEENNKSIELPFKTNAESITVINAKTGDILYEKNGNEKRPVASLTKLMTAKTILDLNPEWERTIEYSIYDDDVTDYAGKWEMPYLNFIPGEKIKVKDLFISSLLGSVSNATYTLYRSTGLIRSAFTEVMNRKANELGMINSSFTEASGLDHKNISTSRDMAKLGQKIFNNFDILVATTSKNYSFSSSSDNYSLKTKNKLLNRDLYILGAKTGYLHEAGKCIMVKADDRNGNQVIVTALGNFSENKDDYFDEVEKLINWGLDNISAQ